MCEPARRKSKVLWIVEELVLLGLLVFSVATGHLWLIPVFLLGSILPSVASLVRRFLTPKS